MLTFETSAIQGVAGIIEKLAVWSMLQMQRFAVLTRNLESTIRESCPSIVYARCTTLE